MWDADFSFSPKYIKILKPLNLDLTEEKISKFFI